MLLAVDVGNTNIKFGFFDGEELVTTIRLSTDKKKTSDEYAVELYTLLKVFPVKGEYKDITGSIISSVVPIVTGRIKDAIFHVFGIEAIVVGPGIKTGLNIKIEDPSTLGADLVVGGVAANSIYQSPCIVISMGTATVWSVIDQSGAMIGGPIAPGVAISLDAMTQNSALLTSVALEAPKSVIGKSTEKSIKAGVVLGFACMIDGMIDKIESELGAECSIIATGGLASTIIPNCSHKIDIKDDLILQGLRIIYNKNAT